MDWLTQNWIWLALALGVGFYFLRGGLGGHAGAHGGVLGGMGHGGHAGEGGHGGHGGQPEDRAPAEVPEAAVDPVGGEAVRTGKALTSVYQGRIYYFASKENRDRFEAAPQEYAQKAAGHPLRSDGAANERPRRRGGC
jgi:YHS domain-containing protein